MKISIFEYKDYKQFINHWIEQAPNKGRGLKTQMAEALGCQTAFVTHVLSGDYHFSLEHAEACARWMELNENELEYLLLLVLYKRSGTKNLEKHFDRQLTLLREQQSILKKRIEIHESLTKEDQQIYYSNWMYAAIHMALLIPNYQSIEGLQKHFQLSTTKIMGVLDFLIQKGLVKQEKGYFKSIQPVLHLEMSSPLLTQHHTHWRLRAIDSMSNRTMENLHYSGVISLSKEDHEWVREKLSYLLKQVIDRIKDSKDEKLSCLCFDWFEI